MAEIDPETFAALKKVLFGNDAETYPSLRSWAPMRLACSWSCSRTSCTRRTSGAASCSTMVRRFFADESADKVTPIGRAAAKTID